MKNLKVLVVLSGLLIGVGIQAKECSDRWTRYSPAITVRNSTPYPGYMLYVNIGANPSKNAEGYTNPFGYKTLGQGETACFKTGLSRSKFMYLREPNRQGQPKNKAIKFDLQDAINQGVAYIYGIEVIDTTFKLKVHGYNAAAIRTGKYDVFDHATGEISREVPKKSVTILRKGEVNVD